MRLSKRFKHIFTTTSIAAVTKECDRIGGCLKDLVGPGSSCVCDSYSSHAITVLPCVETILNGIKQAANRGQK